MEIEMNEVYIYTYIYTYTDVSSMDRMDGTACLAVARVRPVGLCGRTLYLQRS
jgi:hypothetical protein